MELVSDVAIAAVQGAAQDRILIAPGIEVVIPGHYVQLSEGKCAWQGGQIYPKSGWRSPTPRENACLIKPWDTANLNDTVLIAKAPRPLWTLAQELALEDMLTASPKQYEERRSRALPMLLAAATPWLTDLFEDFTLDSCEINLAGRGRRSSVWDADDGRERGLHADNWGTPQRPAVDRDKAGVRVCVNLGLGERWFAFTNLRVTTMLRIVKDSGLGSELLHRLAADLNASATAETFLQHYPDCPVIAIRLMPGEAYVAPVQNLAHDGYMPKRKTVDIALQLSSNDFRLRSRP